MPTIAPSETGSTIDVEWIADASARLPQTAWVIKHARDSRRFARYRSRQIVALCLWMLLPATMLAYVLDSAGGNFLVLMIAMTSFLIVFALALIVKGGRLTPQAALRLAANMERMGGLVDMSGRWRFCLTQDSAEFLWLDRDLRLAIPPGQIDRVERFEGELVFLVSNAPIAAIPARLLTPEQHAAVMALGGRRTGPQPPAPAA